MSSAKMEQPSYIYVMGDWVQGGKLYLSFHTCENRLGTHSQGDYYLPGVDLVTKKKKEKRKRKKKRNEVVVIV